MLEFLETRIAPATFLVTNIADSGAGSLRDAVDQANTTGGADSIAFDPSFFSASTPQKIVLTSGHIDISDTLTIKGPGRDILTIDGNSMSRIFNITDSSSATDRPVKILGVTLTGGSTASAGGAIYSEESLTVENSAVMGNLAAGNGGGIAFSSSTAGKLVVKNSTIHSNTSTAAAGGGIYAFTAAGSIELRGSMVVSNESSSDGGGLMGIVGSVGGKKSSILVESTQFTENIAGANGGGAKLTNAADSGFGKISIKKSGFSENTAASVAGGLGVVSGSVKVEAAIFTGNSADHSGGLHASSPEKFVVTGSSFVGNKATSGNGGAMTVFGVDNAIIDKSQIIGNTASGSGGGMASQAGGILIKGSTVSGNFAGNEGGGLWSPSGFSGARISGSIFSGNSTAGDAGDYGGAIFKGANGFLSITKSDITGNDARAGGGVYLKTNSTLVVQGSLFQGNRATDATLGGGALYSSGGGLTLTGARFLNNWAVADGGAVSVTATTLLQITKNLFSGNTTFADGGALALGASTGTNSVISGNTFTNNSSLHFGGGIFVTGAGEKIFSKNLIQANSALSGGGIAFDMTAAGGKMLKDKVTQNSAVDFGGGLYFLGAALDSSTSLFFQNSASSSPNIFIP
ncbi:MAG: hypothetical protein Fur0032_19040 [Terrimicrobiaceae bacterium]